MAASTQCSLQGKIALVTGGGRGIGRACCQLLAKQGVRVVVADINLQGAKQTLTTLPGPQKHVAIYMDVSDRGSVEKAIKSARDQCSAPPSLLVNCAGILIKTVPFLEEDDETWQKTIDVNLKGTFLVTQVFARLLLDTGNNTKGTVVNISSCLGKSGYKDFSAYSASKGGVIALTKTCAVELISKGIRVNCVLPGGTDTPLARVFGNLDNAIKQMTPLERLAQPEEIAEVVVFLLSERSSYMIGSCVDVAAGYHM